MKLIAAVALLAVLVGCDSAGRTSRAEFEQASAKSDPQRELAPAPKTIEDVEKLGVPVFPGSVLAEGEAGSTVRTSSLGTTYSLKMYAPGEHGAVAKELKAKLKDSVRAGASDVQRITGRTESGDDIEIMLSPAADKTKTLMMVWVTVPKR